MRGSLRSLSAAATDPKSFPMTLESVGFIKMQLRSFGKRNYQYQQLRRKRDNLPKTDFHPCAQQVRVIPRGILQFARNVLICNALKNDLLHLSIWND